MTQRAQKLEERERTHGRRAITLVALCFAIAILYTVFILLMFSHMPRILEDEFDFRGEFFTTVETEWDHLVVDHNSDLSLGDMAWEVTKGEDNETLFSGMQGEDDDELIFVEDLGPGEFGVFLKPTGVNAAKAYDLRVMEFYLSPATIDLIQMVATLVLVILVPFLWYTFMSAATRKYREEYKFATLAIAMTMVLSAVVLFTPWF